MNPDRTAWHRRFRRICVAIFLVFLVVQVVWYTAAWHSVKHNATKTTATVVSLGVGSSTCHSNLCDHSVERYPVYEYKDTKGQTHRYEDKFFNAFKDGNPLRPIFGKEVGDTVDLYYNNDHPDQATVMSSLWPTVTLWLPLLAGMVLLVAAGASLLGERLIKY